MTNCIHCGREAPTGYAACGVCAHRSLEEIYPLRAMPMKHQYDWQVGQQLMCALCGKMDYHEGPEECPGTGAHMKIGHFGGIKPGDILPVADIYESNCGETPTPDLSIIKPEALDALFDIIHKLEKIVSTSEQEIVCLKARIRALEPEQPQPRPLYRWGRPV